MFGTNIPPGTLLLAVYLIVCGVLYLIFAGRIAKAISDSREHYAALRVTKKSRNTTPFNGTVILRILAAVAILWGIYVLVSARPPG